MSDRQALKLAKVTSDKCWYANLLGANIESIGKNKLK